MKSFEEGLDRGAIFCVRSFLEPSIVASFPNIKTVKVGEGGKVGRVCSCVRVYVRLSVSLVCACGCCSQDMRA